ncbi:serine/threonine-protein kinase [Jatrophihabitans sp. DSM 45814]
MDQLSQQLRALPLLGGVISDQKDLGPDTQAMPPLSAMPQTGWVIANRYQVLDRVGAGGLADVFRAHDGLLGRDVAVKVFRSQGDTDDNIGGKTRQQLELQALAGLSHPNLITLFDGSIDASNGPAFLVMELITGPSLSARISEGPLAEPEVRQVATQIADALDYVHERGMVHRDVKPANILLGTDSSNYPELSVRARLSDFGIVRLLGSERLTSADFMVGTATYLAPEQARGADVGPKADVYSLGLVLIEALTGARSFEGPPLAAVMARLERSPDIPEQLPHPWPNLLRDMTATEVDHRPSAAEVARILRGAATTIPPMVAVPVPKPVPELVPRPVPEPVAATSVAAMSAQGPPGGPPQQIPPEQAPRNQPGRPPAGQSARQRVIGWVAAAAVVLALGATGFALANRGSDSSGQNTPPKAPASDGSTTGRPGGVGPGVVSPAVEASAPTTTSDPDSSTDSLPTPSTTASSSPADGVGVTAPASSTPAASSSAPTSAAPSSGSSSSTAASSSNPPSSSPATSPSASGASAAAALG